MGLVSEGVGCLTGTISMQSGEESDVPHAPSSPHCGHAAADAVHSQQWLWEFLFPQGWCRLHAVLHSFQVVTFYHAAFYRCQCIFGWRKSFVFFQSYTVEDLPDLNNNASAISYLLFLDIVIWKNECHNQVICGNPWNKKTTPEMKEAFL